jgi:hypothetical protein
LVQLAPMHSNIVHSGFDCYPWTEVFAWMPVRTISGKRVWLKKVYRRRAWVVRHYGLIIESTTQYGTLFDMLKDAQ